jgi:2-methylcitrate dehydratase PrpD
MSEKSPPYLRTLAEFASATRLETIPDAVMAYGRWIIADCLPVIAAGMQETEMRTFAERHLAHAASGNAWVIGLRRRAAPLDAALLNNTAGTWLELDEGNTYAKGHPGIQLVPAALAVAQTRGLSGEALLAAVLVGYEVSSRINRAASIRNVIHPHGTFGVIGAAVAVGHLLRFDAAKMLTLINVSASLAIASSYRTLNDGATVRNLYTGHSGYMGQIAVQAVESGFSGERDGVATTFGEIIGEDYEPARVIEGLGSEWMTLAGYFKLHPTARSIQTAIDALEDLMQRTPAAERNAAHVRKIEASTYKRAAEKGQTAVTTSFGAKFSIPFALATILHHGRSGLESFGETAVRNPEVQRLASCVVLQENRRYTELYPKEQWCDITVTMDDGRKLTGSCSMTKGEPGNPVTAEELVKKFRELGTPVWGEALTEELLGIFMKLETVPDLRALSERLVL